MVREHSNSISSNGYPPPPNANTAQGPPLPPPQHQHPQVHPYYAYGGSAPGGPPGYPEGPFSGPPSGNASAGGDSNKNNAVVGHHHHHHLPPPYTAQVQGPPVPGRPQYGPGPGPRNPPLPHKPAGNNSNNSSNKNLNSKKNPAPARPYPAPDGPPSATPNPAASSWQGMHLPPPDNGNNGNNVNGSNGRMPYGSWNAEQAAVGHHAAAHHHHAAAAAAAAGYWPPPSGPHYGGPPNGSPQRPPPPHFWRPGPGPPPPHAPQSQHPPPPPHAGPQSSQHPPPVVRQDLSRPSRPGGPLPVPSGASSPAGSSSVNNNNNTNTKNNKMSKSAINKHNSNNIGLHQQQQYHQQQQHQQQQSPPGVNKASNKNKIASLHSTSPGNQNGMPADLVARLGATSPTQIETTHRDEVQIMGCTCKKTRCLKLYCQCFGVKLHCGPACRCLQCFNTRKHEKQRKEAMRQILARNPGAFDTKFQKNLKATAAITNKVLAHKLGCKCRKSACMKKYCECYAGSVKCSPSCRCVGCKNIGLFGGPSGEARGGADAKTQKVGTLSSVAGLMRRTLGKGKPRRKKSEPFQAAQNLTFLKHGSPDSVKSMVRKAPGATAGSGKPGDSGVHEVASMPSLASSSEGTSPGEFARNRSKDEDEYEHDRMQHDNMSKLNGLMASGTKPVLDEQDDDVKTLLMAAYAMAEIGKGSSPAKRGCSPGTTESTTATATAMTMMSAQSSPATYRDVKRSRSDLEGADSAASSNSRSLDSKRMHFE